MKTYKYINLLLHSPQLSWISKYDLENLTRELLKCNYTLYEDNEVTKCLVAANLLAKTYYKAIENAKLCINAHLSAEGYADKTYVDTYIETLKIVNNNTLVIEYNRNLVFKYKIKSKTNIMWKQIDNIWTLK